MCLCWQLAWTLYWFSGIGKVEACMWCTGALYATNIGAYHPLGIEGWRFAFLSVGLLSASIGDLPLTCLYCYLIGLLLAMHDFQEQDFDCRSAGQPLQQYVRSIRVTCALMQGS